MLTPLIFLRVTAFFHIVTCLSKPLVPPLRVAVVVAKKLVGEELNLNFKRWGIPFLDFCSRIWSFNVVKSICSIKFSWVTIFFSQELIGALLACALFCLFPTSNRGARHLPMVNFDHLFAYVSSTVCYYYCIYAYFSICVSYIFSVRCVLTD